MSLEKKHIESYNKTRHTDLKDPLCYAPFISLNFDQAGNVRACCFNVNHVLGKYPNQTINTIIESSATKELRNAIQNHDFKKGCYNCEQQLLSENYYSVHARHFDLIQNKLPNDFGQVPLVLEFEIS
ncbi:MAG: SPASM domain-containing protein [Pseudobdellovibrionaceae bacterium]